MSQISSILGNLPGMGTVVETFEQAYAWGIYPRYYTAAYIGPTAADPTNNPTWELRPGLILGKQITTGQWVNYNPTAADGSEVAQGVMPIALRMQDVSSGLNTAKFWAVMVSGGIKASALIGLDNMARVALSNQFYFDDNFPGLQQFPWQRFQTKIANYQLLASDNLSHFDNLGAVGEVDFTLPPIANGYVFGFHNFTSSVLKVISTEGGNIVGSTATQGSVSVTAVGGGFTIFSNPAGTKWIVENASSYNQVVSFL